MLIFCEHLSKATIYRGKSEKEESSALTAKKSRQTAEIFSPFAGKWVLIIPRKPEFYGWIRSLRTVISLLINTREVLSLAFLASMEGAEALARTMAPKKLPISPLAF